MKIKLLLSFAIIICAGFHPEPIQQSASQPLTLDGTDHELLNKIVFEYVNELRVKKGKTVLEHDTQLLEIAEEYQTEFQFRRFHDPSRYERKMDRTIYDKKAKRKIDASLLLPICAQYHAIDYTEGKEFFFDDEDTDTELHLFYGPRSKSKRKDAVITPIPYHSYKSFAKKLIDNMESERKKELLNKAYKWGAVKLQWNYKTLYKNRIPKIKAVFILAGYQTALIRD